MVEEGQRFSGVYWIMNGYGVWLDMGMELNRSG